MLDRVSVEIENPSPALLDWRARLENLARQRWDMAQRHPWVMQVGTHRPPLGPNILATAEATLQAIDGIGLSDREMQLVGGLMTNYVRGAVRAALEAREVAEQTGITDEQWWAENAALLQGLIEPDRYPTTLRIGESNRVSPGLGLDLQQSFEFGLQRALDGIEVFIAGRDANPT